MTKEQVACCWSGSSLKENNYTIDHAFPFARWPNNDLWNLLPTSDKLNNSREFITTLWQQGWQDNSEEFFTKANFSLPSLNANNRNFDDVFEAFSLQRNRIKDFQQLANWQVKA